MKREFLQSLSAEAPLSKEVIDAIMAENGRDIQKTRAAFADYGQLKEELDRLRQDLQDQEQLRQAAAQWEQRCSQAARDHAVELARLTFDHRLEQAIGKAGGRNAKAIRALLDVDALRESEDQEQSLTEALEGLKAECRYLFAGDVPPPYAHLTGAWTAREDKAPTSLAGALREKFERK